MRWDGAGARHTLERDARAGGLTVLHRSGIFFKALANFQWDQLLGTDVISADYLDGCYQLGTVYPDLCASVYLVCERFRNTRTLGSSWDAGGGRKFDEEGVIVRAS